MTRLLAIASVLLSLNIDGCVEMYAIKSADSDPVLIVGSSPVTVEVSISSDVKTESNFDGMFDTTNITVWFENPEPVPISVDLQVFRMSDVSSNQWDLIEGVKTDGPATGNYVGGRLKGQPIGRQVFIRRNIAPISLGEYHFKLAGELCEKEMCQPFSIETDSTAVLDTYR